MMTTTWDDKTAKALADFVACLRPAWDRPGILAAVHTAYGKHHNLAAVAHIAVDCAADPACRTPGMIAVRNVPRPPETTQPPSTGTKCPRCDRYHVGDEPCFRYDEQTAHDGAAKCRQALKGTA